MTTAISEIQNRRQTLLAESAAQRQAFSHAWEGIERPLLHGKAAAHKLNNPWIWAAVGLVAFKLPFRKLSRIFIMLCKGWRMARKVHAIIQ